MKITRRLPPPNSRLLSRVAALGVAIVSTSALAGVSLTPISTGFNNPIGIDHHVPTNQVVLSVNYAGGQPYNFELVASNGSRTQFSNISGLTDEVKIATARTTANGFIAGELFTGSGVAGVIVRIAPDGSSVQNPWVTLPNEPGLLRGSLYIDRTGVFGGDLIAVTTAGNVWRVTSAGAATPLASIGTHLEGLVTVPNDVARYGPWAGKILAGAEEQGRIYSIDTAGNVDFFSLGINPEDFEIIPANENFFGVDFGGQTLWGAPPSEFSGMTGDLLIAQEIPGILFHVRWDGSQFQVNGVAQVTQWEHVTFSPAGILEIPPACVTFDADVAGAPIPPHVDISGTFLQDQGIVLAGISLTNGNPGVFTNIQGPPLSETDDLVPVTGNFITTLADPERPDVSDVGRITVDFVDTMSHLPRAVDFADVTFIDVEDSIGRVTAWSGPGCTGQLLDSADTGPESNDPGRNGGHIVVTVGALDSGLAIASICIEFGDASDSASVDQLCFRYTPTAVGITSDRSGSTVTGVRPGEDFALVLRATNESRTRFRGFFVSSVVVDPMSSVRLPTRTNLERPIGLPAHADATRNLAYRIPSYWGNRHVGLRLRFGQSICSVSGFVQARASEEVVIVP